MKNINTFKLLSDYEAEKSAGTLNTPNVSFVAEDNGVRYLLEYEDPYNGYEYVDLGLPSGLKWATCNIGADSPEKTGLYFAWGETTGYTAEQVTGGEHVFSEAVYNAGSAASISTDLSPSDGNDAARANLGGKWRMPTKAEFQELKDNCTFANIDDYKGTGVEAALFTSKVNGNSVIFPATGYWSDSLLNNYTLGYSWSASWDSVSTAFTLGVLLGLDAPIYGHGRRCGIPVRGVCK